LQDLAISATQLSHGTREKKKEVSVEDIVKHELVLLSGLSFQIHCHHSFRPLIGFMNDLRIYASGKGGWFEEDKLPDLTVLHKR